MSWMQKLCEVYDHVITTSGAEGDRALLPVGFLSKKVKFRVFLHEDGTFSTAQLIPEEQQDCVIPSTPQAESRTGARGKPYPLVEQMKYLVEDGAENPRLEDYLSQLSQWCEFEESPDCLRVLKAYLEKKTLLQDMEGVLGSAVRYHKDREVKDAAGPDAKSFVSFAVESLSEESELHRRNSVKKSWTRFQFSKAEGEPGLCYISGEQRHILENHPKVEGNAKLISAKEGDGFPFKYKGRFTEAHSSATVSVEASLKAHNALKWLVDKQGFRRYGMTAVIWNLCGTPMKVPMDDTSLFDDLEEEERPLPDTMQEYGEAVAEASTGYAKRLKEYDENQNLTGVHRQRMSEVVLMAMEAATDGRMSITCYQELPGNTYIERLQDWYTRCCWEFYGKEGHFISTPTHRQIAEAVMGADAVQTARMDGKNEKAVTKLMRETQMRLLNCTVNAVALPEDMVRSAFHRAVQPLSFTDDKGTWRSFQWQACVNVTCALIRKRTFDRGQEPAPKPELDRASRDRDYLYGRLFAVAHKIELDTREAGQRKLPTNAVRMMPQLVQHPFDTWPKLHSKLIPCLKQLESGGKFYQNVLGEIAHRFTPEDRKNRASLSDSFLLGAFSQNRELYRKKEEERPAEIPLRPAENRSVLFGYLLGVADAVECEATAKKDSHSGKTAALRLMTVCARNPVEGWRNVHDTLIPYLEKLGEKRAGYYQWLLGKIESCFPEAERTAETPLDSGYLHGYYKMRFSLHLKNGLDMEKWKAIPENPYPLDNREAAFGSLLALENEAERLVLDLEKTEETNRSSNALRFLTRSARRPNEVWQYLRQRMRPYAEKERFRLRTCSSAVDVLYQRIQEQGWDTDVPLHGTYLHNFYTDTIKNHRGE